MIRPFIDSYPVFDESNFIADSAEVIGNVVLGPYASVWFNSTVRGDVNWIRIGKDSNIQDNAVVHVTNRTGPTRIGSNVTVGHSAVVHACTIKDSVLVGIGSVILDGAWIGEHSIVGAKSLVTQNMRVPPRSLVYGSPARVVRDLTEEEVESIQRYAENYLRYSRIYRGEEAPTVNPFYSGKVK